MLDAVSDHHLVENLAAGHAYKRVVEGAFWVGSEHGGRQRNVVFRGHLLVSRGWDWPPANVSAPMPLLDANCTYTDAVAVASRAVERLMFLACSLTLDLASSIDVLELAAVDRARTRATAEGLFELAGTRILEADRDMAGSRQRRRRGRKKSQTEYEGEKPAI